VAVDPRHPATVYAAIGAKVLKTTNAGKTWQPIAAGLPIADTRGTCHCLSQGGVTTLAVDPRRTGTVYAAVTMGGIYKVAEDRRYIAMLAINREGLLGAPGMTSRRTLGRGRGCRV
jgi:photosystem II stability/assembly factor-like uncharacterized protein